MRTKRDAGLPPTVDAQSQPLVVTQEREYKLITPLFGGGAVAGERDEVTVVRGTEIRGQLRFWWRACYGGRYATAEEMKMQEDRIWGAAAQSKKEEKERATSEEDKKLAATVQISVEVLNKGTLVEPFPILTPEEYKRKKGKETKNKWESVYERSSGIPEYAAFMLQLTNKEKIRAERPARKLAYKNVEFKLIISFPKESRTDVEEALWAWETFGGVGARTRRGFGALQLKKICGKETIDLPTSETVAQWIQEHIVNLQIKSEPQVKGNAPGNVPSLTANMSAYVMRPTRDATQAWNGLIWELSSFRQFPHGRVKRSKWPEAEAIRAYTKKRHYKYMPLAHPKKFPRAAFGLPIVFHFKDGDRGDPHDSTLQGREEGHDRLSSPLILRPLICKDNKAVGLVVVLDNVVLPDELLLKEEGGESHRVHARLDDQEKVEPLEDHTNVLQAFINYLKGNKR